MQDESQPVQELLARLKGAIEAAADPAELANAKARAIGRDGELTARLKTLGKLTGEERARRS